MHITVLTSGSRGDVQPLIALGLGLQKAGHKVRLATHLDYQALVCNSGLNFFPVTGNIHTLLNSERGQTLFDTRHNLKLFTAGLVEVIGPFVSQILSDFWKACQGAEAIFYSVQTLPAYYIAHKLRIPAYPICLQPIIRTCYRPSILLPVQSSFGRIYNWLTHLVAEQLFWQPLRPLVNQWLKELGGPPAQVWGPFGNLYRSKTPILCGYSPTIAPKPRDWDDEIAVTGYWFLNHSPVWQPPADLLDFLASGSPPIYIGFGSMTAMSMEERLEIVLKTVAQSRRRAILATGWAGCANHDLPDEIFKIEDAPHGWLFPQMEAVIHHGGAGTTAAAIRAGIPSIITPFFFDQFFWGQQVYKLGIGVAPILPKSLSVEILMAAIRRVTGDQGMRQRAASLSRQIQAEDGVAQAVQVFQKSLSRYN